MTSINVAPLSKAERDRRWHAIRKGMIDKGFDCLIIRGTSSKWDSGTANVRYTTQIGGNGEEAIVVFPMEGEPIVMVWGASQVAWWPQAQDWVSDVRLGKPSWGIRTAECVKEFGCGAGRIGIVGIGGSNEAGKCMSYDVYCSIKDNLPDAELVPASNLIEDVRLIKSDEEVGLLERSARLGDVGVRAMIEAAKPGVKSYEVYGAIMGAIFAAGGESPMFLMYDSSARPRHALRFPSDRPLAPGDFLLQEIAPKCAGYWSQIMVPVCLGEPDALYRRLAETIELAYQEGIKALKPGISSDALTNAINRPVLEAGFTWFRPQWQGVGLEQTEEPSDRNHPGASLTPGLEIREGMVIGFQPMAATEDGKCGLQIGDTVVVTKTGAKRLGETEMRLYTV